MDEVILENRLTRIEAKLDVVLEFHAWRQKVDAFMSKHDQEQAHYAGIQEGQEALRKRDMKHIAILFSVIQGIGGALLIAATKVL